MLAQESNKQVQNNKIFIAICVSIICVCNEILVIILGQ